MQMYSNKHTSVGTRPVRLERKSVSMASAYMYSMIVTQRLTRSDDRICAMPDATTSTPVMFAMDSSIASSGWSAV